ncbi:uncharacterized protein TRUGW13939_07862, partial [Talaromyces rugulosus]
MDTIEKVDVLVCGSGSAGLSAATWLARCGIRCKVLERRDGPLTLGQADGVQCRTVEIFESFGIGEELLREAYHVLEVVFWADDGSDVIKRTDRTADTQPGLSHQPHVILNQARINKLLIEAMYRFNKQEIDYGYDIKHLEVDSQLAKDPSAYPIRVITRKGNKLVQFEAKYALACDGAHSIVRRSLNFYMIGDSSDSVWGVMDIVPRTNFPDIRKKAIIRSKLGNLLIIPREGDSYSLVRFYIELPAGIKATEVKLDDIQRTASKILGQYDVDFTETIWWSAYPIGQRHSDSFHKDFRVFLAGDACHTHSPKAGQGMNVSLQDGYNIGWKLASVLKGLAPPSILETYVLERRKTAVDLIKFDRYFSKLFTSAGKISTEEFQKVFIQSGKYTAGLTAKYDKSLITSHIDETQELATNVVVGMRLPSAQCVRFCDSKPLQLMTSLKSDGRWRVIAFAGDLKLPINKARLTALGYYLASPESPVYRFTPIGGDIDSLIELILVAYGNRHEIELGQIPLSFYPVSGENKVRDLHKIFFDDEGYDKSNGQLYNHLGINPQKGCIIIARPDQYVSAVFGLDSYRQIGKFFEGFSIPQDGQRAFSESK